MALDISSNLGSATVVTGGTDAPAAGTVETFVVSSPVDIPTITSGVTQFRIIDALASTISALAEIMIVTNVVGASWTVVRGAEGIGGNGATPVSHAANWKAVLVVTEQAMPFGNSTVNVLRYATPAFDLNSSLDVVSVSGASVFTSATANWTAGQNLVIRGAATGSTVYQGVISTVSGASATCFTAAGASGSNLQAFWFTDDTVPWQTALNNAPAGSILDGPLPFASGVMQRLDVATWTTASALVADASITTADTGKWTAASCFPAGSLVGAVSGGSFTLVNAAGASLLPTANGTAASISVGGLFIPSGVQLIPEMQQKLLAPEVSAIVTGISSNLRTRGRVFGVVQAGNIAPQVGGTGSLAWSPPNAAFGLTGNSGIGGALLPYSLNQIGPKSLTGSSVTPTAFAPMVGVVVPNVGGWFIGSLLIPNAYISVVVQGGPGRIANVVSGAFQIDLLVDHCYDYLKVDSLTCGVWWDYVEGFTFNPSGGGSVGLDNYAMNNRNFLVMGRCDAFHLNTLNGVIGAGGILLTASPDTSLNPSGSYGTIDKADIDQACSYAIEVGNTTSSTCVFIGTLTAGGNAQGFGPKQGGTGATAVSTTNATGKLKIASWTIREYGTTSTEFSGSTLIVPGSNPG